MLTISRRFGGTCQLSSGSKNKASKASVEVTMRALLSPKRLLTFSGLHGVVNASERTQNGTVSHIRTSVVDY
jgi:hypothetical protein